MEGFSDNSVRHIIQDKKGFLWFGTLNGLNRYDGNEIKIFKSEPGNPNSLSYNRILWFMEDSLGYLWITTFDGSYHRFDPRTEKFINLTVRLEKLGINGIAIGEITQSSAGVLWVRLRQGGAARFIEHAGSEDIKTELLDTSKLLPGNIVSFIHAGPSGRLYFGTDNGLAVLRCDTMSFKDNKNSRVFEAGKNINFIDFICIDGKKVFATEYNGLYILDSSSMQPVTSLHHVPVKGRILEIGGGKSGDVLVLTGNDGVFYYDVNTGKGNVYMSKDLRDIESEVIDYRFIYADLHGKFWIAAKRRGLIFFDPVNRKTLYHPMNSTQRLFQGDDDKHFLFEDSNGDFWVGIYGSGIFKFNRAKNSFEQFQQQRDNSNSLSSNNVLTLFEDHSKNLWVGTFQGGLNKTALLKYPFNFTQPVKNATSGTLNEVRAVLYDSLDRLWVGTKEGNIFGYDKSGKLFFTYPDDLQTNGFKQSNVYSMLMDRDGNLWIGTKGLGITLIRGFFRSQNPNYEKFEIEVFTNNPEDPNSLAYNAVYALCQDHYGQIWAGTYNGGLCLIEDPSKVIVFRNFRNIQGDDNSLSDNRVRYITQDSKKNLWIGTSDGLNLLKAVYVGNKEKRFISFKNDLSDINSLTRNDIYWVQEDKKGRIWVATSGGGLNRLIEDTKDGTYRFEYLDRNDGLPGDVIFSIAEDNNGNLWLGTDNGLCHYSPDNKTFDNYIAEEGLVDNLFSETSCAKSSGNLIAFGQKSGFIVFNPDSILKDKKIYPVVVTDFFLFNKKQIPGTKGSPLEKSVELTESIVLKHNQNYFSFQFSMLDYMHSERCQYAYYLEGIESEWNHVGNKRMASYTNLDPGEYTFHVKASNHEGTWNNDPVSIKIIIKPPFYKTLLFRLLALLFGFSLILGIYYFRTEQLRRQKIHLENLVTERTSEIEEKNKKLLEQTYLLNETNTLLEERQQFIEEQSEELRTQAEELNEKNIDLRTLNMTKDKFFSIIAHDLKNPFNAVLGFAELLSIKYEALPDEKKKQYIEVIFDSVKKIYRLLENLLQWARSQTGNIPYKPENFLLGEVISNNVELSANQINEKNLKVVQEVPDSIEVYADKNMINTVLRNILTNAIKFSENGEIRINVSQSEDLVMCSISDSGVGIPKSRLKTIFEIDNSKSTEGTKGESGTGLGLIICKEFVEKNGGKIFVESEENKGSTFKFTIPPKRS
ncbi:MAG: hypothetical protein JXB00_19490 [Bacteroidales bacterium]|nr:hypothetical protein [Bacteroidales bacterium]